MGGKNIGIRVPAPGEAHNGVVTAIRQIISKLGLEAAPYFEDITIGGDVKLEDLEASKLVATDADKILESTDAVDWIDGTANQVIVTDDTDGTVTLSTPQDIHTGASPTFNVLTLTGLQVEATVVTGAASITTGTAFEGDTTSGDYSLGLPALAGAGRVLLICCSGANTLTLDPDGAETINGDTTFDLIADESLIVVDFSTEWRVF